MPLRLASVSLHPKGRKDTLFDGVKSNFRIAIHVPSELVLPNIFQGDLVEVTFRCGEGSLEKGNVMTGMGRLSK